MKAVVLAGGVGSRICSVLGCTGKQFIRIRGLELFMYPITSLWSIGIDYFIVVSNPIVYDKMYSLLEKYSSKIGFEYILDLNPYPDTMNGNTALIGLSRVDEPVVVTVSDHIYPPEMPKLLLEKGGSLRCDIVVLGDENPLVVDVGEATKLRVDNGVVVEASKNLTRYEYIDTGLFLFNDPGKVVSLFDVEEPIGLMDIVSDRRLITRVIGFNGVVWKDVDTLEDLTVIMSKQLKNVINELLDSMRKS